VAAHNAEKAASWYAEKNTEVGNGATALHAAVENGHLAAVRALLNGGARQLCSMQGASPLLIAIQYRHPEIALELLDWNGDNDSAHIDAATPHDGSRPLIAATYFGFAKVCSVVAMLQQSWPFMLLASHSRTIYRVRVGC